MRNALFITNLLPSPLVKCLVLSLQDEGKISLNTETDIELSVIPLTSQGKAPEHLLSEEDFYDRHEDNDNFTTQQLFSFAWQIARGMVSSSFYFTDRPSSVNKMFIKNLQFA